MRGEGKRREGMAEILYHRSISLGFNRKSINLALQEYIFTLNSSH